jgi:hypothetical protein
MTLLSWNMSSFSMDSVYNKCQGTLPECVLLLRDWLHIAHHIFQTLPHVYFVSLTNRQTVLTECWERQWICGLVPGQKHFILQPYINLSNSGQRMFNSRETLLKNNVILSSVSLCMAFFCNFCVVLTGIGFAAETCIFYTSCCICYSHLRTCTSTSTCSYTHACSRTLFLGFFCHVWLAHADPPSLPPSLCTAIFTYAPTHPLTHSFTLPLWHSLTGSFTCLLAEFVSSFI